MVGNFCGATVLRVATCVVLLQTERVAARREAWTFGNGFGGYSWALTVGNAGTVPCVAKFIVTLRYTEYRMILSSVLRVLLADVIIFQNVSLLLYCSRVFVTLYSVYSPVVPSHWPVWLSVALNWIPFARISLPLHQLAIPSRRAQYRWGLKPLSQEVKKRHTFPLNRGSSSPARWSCSTDPTRVYLQLGTVQGRHQRENGLQISR